MIIRAIGLFFAIFWISFTNAQEEVNLVLSRDSTNSNIESYSDKLGIYAYGISKFSNFELKGEDQSESLRYSPNENLNIGLGFNYKWMGLGVALNLGFINSDNDLYGKTNSLDFQLDIYTRKLLLNGNLQFYQGYYWRNPENYFPDWSIEDSAIVRPDIITGTFGFSGTYVFNHENFSFKAAFQNTERQLSSAGSWLLGARFSIYAISADSSLVPNELHDLYPNAVSLAGLSTVNLGISGGYTYTLVFAKYFYFNAALMIGLNLQSVAAYDLQGASLGEDGKMSSNAFFRAALGCNKPRHFYGFSVSTDSFLVKDPNATEFSYSFGKVRFYFGRRFNLGKN